MMRIDVLELIVSALAVNLYRYSITYEIGMNLEDEI